MSMGVTKKGCKLCKYFNGESCVNEKSCIDYRLYESIYSKIKPSYYGTGIDVIEFCLRNNLTFMQGNVIKYVTRYKEKNGIEDLEKAKEYIDRLIDFEKRSEK